MTLSPAHRTAVRRIADGKPVHPSTLAALQRRGLASVTYATGGPTRRRKPTSRKIVSLTPAGERAHADIMRSGDGPEDLKALLRF